MLINGCRPPPDWWASNADRLRLRRIGRELVGPCPDCGGVDRFAVREDGVFHCRGCHPNTGSFRAVLTAAGWDGSAMRCETRRSLKPRTPEPRKAMPAPAALYAPGGRAAWLTLDYESADVVERAAKHPAVALAGPCGKVVVRIQPLPCGDAERREATAFAAGAMDRALAAERTAAEVATPCHVNDDPDARYYPDARPLRWKREPTPAEVLWEAALPVAEGDPAWRYLIFRRLCWPPEEPLPESVRWLPRERWPETAALNLPPWAAGGTLYRYEAGDSNTRAVGIEALTGDGGRPDGARWRRTVGTKAGAWFTAESPPADEPADEVALCEGEVDALASCWLANPRRRECRAYGGSEAMAKCELRDARPVVVVADGDFAGLRAALQVKMRHPAAIVVRPRGDAADELARRVRNETALVGGDVADALPAAWREIRS